MPETEQTQHHDPMTEE